MTLQILPPLCSMYLCETPLMILNSECSSALINIDDVLCPTASNIQQDGIFFAAEINKYIHPTAVQADFPLQ